MLGPWVLRTRHSGQLTSPPLLSSQFRRPTTPLITSRHSPHLKMEAKMLTKKAKKLGKEKVEKEPENTVCYGYNYQGLTSVPTGSRSQAHKPLNTRSGGSHTDLAVPPVAVQVLLGPPKLEPRCDHLHQNRALPLLCSGCNSTQHCWSDHREKNIYTKALRATRREYCIDFDPGDGR